MNSIQRELDELSDKLAKNHEALCRVKKSKLENFRRDQNLKAARRFITEIDEQALLGIGMMDEGENPVLEILCEIRRLVISAENALNANAMLSCEAKEEL